jgi:hypothetical protein
MSKAIQKRLKDQEWYQALIEELNATIIETITMAREAVLQGKWLVGEYIEKAVKDFERAEIYGSKINSLLAKDLNWSEREIARCRQFYNKFPADTWEKALMQLPGGKELTWHKMVVQYLPDGSSSGKDDKHYMSVLVNETEKAIYIKSEYRKYKIKYF